MASTLERYRQKRDFRRTPEPPPQPEPPGQSALSFVIQKHAARRLHYDFRLELDGVLKSWAVPKGPSVNPADKRLAVLVEDHPIDYASFEGVIPKGQYGAGEVIVWDSGTYSPDEDGQTSFHDRAAAEKRMRQGLTKGKISIFLRGQKLQGSWTLVKSRRGPNEWLLIKHADEFADTSRNIGDEETSIVTGLSLENLREGVPAPDDARAHSPFDPSTLPGAQPARFPSELAPMLPSLTASPFSHPDWLFEPKLDGIRAIALLRDGEVKLQSRRGLNSTRQWPQLARELAEAHYEAVVLDGEIVALDAAGRPSFHRLQERMNLADAAEIRRADAEIPVIYYVFDVLHVDGYDLRRTPLEQRKTALQRVLAPTEHVRMLEHFEGVGEIAYQALLEYGFEGMVAKQRASAYDPGRRARSWLKIKATRSEDLVIGGYSEGMGARANTFGALLVGTYDAAGALRYAAHVGTGFDDRTLAQVLKRLEALRTDECPFAAPPPEDGRRSGFGRPRGARGKTYWVRPELVAEVKYSEWTPDGSLRAPVFLGLREDKAPSEVQAPTLVPPPTVNEASAHQEGRPQPTPDDAASSPTAGLAADVERVLEQLAGPGKSLALDVQGHRIGLTNLEKVLWPDASGGGYTKRDFARYLAQVSPYLLPHLRDRPLTLIRLPNGIYGQRFYQKHSEALPDFVQTVRHFSKHNAADQDYLLCNNFPTLLWLGQIAGLELHSAHTRIDPAPDAAHLSQEFVGSRENFLASLLNYPEFVVFDLDPYIYSGREAAGAEPELNEKAFAKTAEVALWLKELLDGLSLPAFVKTTGKTGLHIYVPILRQFDSDVARSAAETVAIYLARLHPQEITVEWSVAKRPGKVFADYNQNARGKTLASIYSPRAVPEASVSMPLRWEELRHVYPTQFTILTAPRRLAQVGDLWAGILDAKHDLAAALAP